MKKAQFALFVYLALVLSFSLVVFISSQQIKGVYDYKFNINKKIGQYYNETINQNYNSSLIKLIFDLRNINMFSFYSFYEKELYGYNYKNAKEFLILSAVKGDNISYYSSEDALAVLDWRLIKKDLDDVKNKLKRSPEDFFKDLNNYILNSFILSLLANSELNIEDDNDYSFDTYLVIFDNHSYLIDCFYNSYIVIGSLPFFNLFKKEPSITKIPIELCIYHLYKNNGNDDSNLLIDLRNGRIKAFYLDNLDYFLLLFNNNLSMNFRQYFNKNKNELLSILRKENLENELILKGKVEISSDYKDYFLGWQKINNKDNSLILLINTTLLYYNNSKDKIEILKLTN
ncbi:MAG: hypothetical protein ABGW69_01355 [Nanoarchaeota archaeon]